MNPQTPMNSTLHFSNSDHSTSRRDLSLKRKGSSNTRSPMGIDSTAPFDTGDPSPDPHGIAALQAAWDKLFRARALLEAEQAHVRDDRIAIQGEIEALQMREQSVSARELRIEQVELRAKLDQQEAEAAKESMSTIARLTQAPFDMARSVFGSKK